MNLPENPDRDPEQSPNPALLAALTTEHYTLQASRSSTVVEANGRSSLFLSATSAATVALALVAQLDRLGNTFLVFTLVVLPTLMMLGLTSYARLADLAVHDAHYARAIGRIRAFYFTLDPAGRQYWLQPAGDDPHAIMRQVGERHTRWHHLSHAATSVAAVTAVVTGAFLAVSVSASTRSAVPLPALALVGSVAAIALFVALMLDQERRWSRSDAQQQTRFLPDGTPAMAVATLRPGQVSGATATSPAPSAT
jgi:hypothetical protein